MLALFQSFFFFFGSQGEARARLWNSGHPEASAVGCCCYSFCFRVFFWMLCLSTEERCWQVVVRRKLLLSVVLRKKFFFSVVLEVLFFSPKRAHQSMCFRLAQNRNTKLAGFIRVFDQEQVLVTTTSWSHPWFQKPLVSGMSMNLAWSKTRICNRNKKGFSWRTAEWSSCARRTTEWRSFVRQHNKNRILR